MAERRDKIKLDLTVYLLEKLCVWVLSRFLSSVKTGDLIPQRMRESKVENGSVVFARFATKSCAMTSLERT